MVKEKFIQAFLTQVSPEDTLILAVSGGVDSMVLLDLVLFQHPADKIIVGHFDHSLRWAESDEDRVFIANYCNKKSITFESEKMDIASLAKNEKSSIEMTARKYRYDFLRRVSEKYSAKYILTAHHQDDCIETALFNLIRSTKLWGIHALGVLNDAIFRPLLGISKQDILAYAQENSIFFREDSTNTDTAYLRNHIRHNILPEFAKINPAYRDALTWFIDYSEELKHFIDAQIKAWLWGEDSLSVLRFANESPFFQREIIRFLYESANMGTVGLSEGNIEELRRYILTAEGSTVKEVGKLRLEKKKNSIYHWLEK